MVAKPVPVLLLQTIRHLREKDSNSCLPIAAPFTALHHLSASSHPHLELELGELATHSPPTVPLPDVPLLSSCRRKMLKLCGETQDRLAQELILFEFTIERDVIEPLYDLAEVSAPGCNTMPLT